MKRFSNLPNAGHFLHIEQKPSPFKHQGTQITLLERAQSVFRQRFSYILNVWLKDGKIQILWSRNLQKIVNSLLNKGKTTPSPWLYSIILGHFLEKTNNTFCYFSLNFTNAWFSNRHCVSLWHKVVLYIIDNCHVTISIISSMLARRLFVLFFDK